MRRPITAWRSTMNGGAVARVMSRASLETLIGDAQKDLTALHAVAVIAQDLGSAHDVEFDSAEFLELCEKYGAPKAESLPRVELCTRVRTAMAEAVKAAAL